MKTLDLNAYGVSEMNRQEMVETDGGGWLAVGLSAACCIAACATPVTWGAAVGLALSTASLVVSCIEADKGN